MMTASGLAVAARDCDPAVIDDDHLGRMTLGDRQLEQEVLRIFARQIAIMFGRIRRTEPALAAAAAHTLLGSARGIGAWRVAEASERLERVAAADRRSELDDAITELRAAADEVSAAIDARCGAAMAELPREH
jgi:HPt (histidine-containing phosphotransfer) domain-containing protein